jgi:hypothetical protein
MATGSRSYTNKVRLRGLDYIALHSKVRTKKEKFKSLNPLMSQCFSSKKAYDTPSEVEVLPIAHCLARSAIKGIANPDLV